MHNCAVFFSGAGTTARALLEYARQPTCNYTIRLLVTDNPAAPGLQLLAEYKCETLVLPWVHTTRQAWGDMLAKQLHGYSLDLLILAGFMRLLDPATCRRWHGQLINIHPSLLPGYKGLDTHRRALKDGELRHGFSVHLVTRGVDEGTILAQCAIAILADDTPASLQQRVQQQERYWYPRLVDWIAAGRLCPATRSFDNQPLTNRGLMLCDNNSHTVT